MTPEQIIARALCNADSDRTPCCPSNVACTEWRLFEQEQKAVTAALTAAGYAIVPVEPTPDMCVAGVKVMSGAYPDHIEPTTAVIIGEPKDVYRAMIAAASEGKSDD